MEERDIKWSNQLEILISQEGEKCRGLAYIHQRCEQIYNSKNNYLTIPIIIASTLAGTASVGSTTLFPDDTKVGSIVIGLISISVGILNTINSYFAFAKKAEAHRIAYLQYSKLFSLIAIEMSLPREERQEPEHILSTLRGTMERLSETTPSPLSQVLDEFNQKFKDKYPDVAKPQETNGLQKISIFRSPSVQNKLEEVKIEIKNPLRVDGIPQEHSQ
jgi:hypothetical protein